MLTVVIMDHVFSSIHLPIIIQFNSKILLLAKIHLEFLKSLDAVGLLWLTRLQHCVTSERVPLDGQTGVVPTTGGPLLQEEQCGFCPGHGTPDQLALQPLQGAGGFMGVCPNGQFQFSLFI
ncbi:hypothetical protein CHARACLAT_033399 [Characodon lateralis]|uniref:Uncharacterized protein n=1 Tax=Characodon lateralis TaxID=208331 RepID=A0ABU7EIW7_9TELE|nr:hypothetical protein [Characodon lateralis]